MALTQVEPYILDSSANYTMGKITVTNSANLGNIANITITGGSNGQALLTDGAGNLSFGSAGSPSGKIVALNMFLGF